MRAHRSSAADMRDPHQYRPAAPSARPETPVRCTSRRRLRRPFYGLRHFSRLRTEVSRTRSRLNWGTRVHFTCPVDRFNLRRFERAGAFCSALAYRVVAVGPALGVTCLFFMYSPSKPASAQMVTFAREKSNTCSYAPRRRADWVRTYAAVRGRATFAEEAEVKIRPSALAWSTPGTWTWRATGRLSRNVKS